MKIMSSIGFSRIYLFYFLGVVMDVDASHSKGFLGVDQPPTSKTEIHSFHKASLDLFGIDVH